MDYGKMIKTIVVVCVATVMVLGFAACRNGDDEGSLGDISVGVPPADEPADEPIADEPAEEEDGPQAQDDEDNPGGVFGDQATGAIGKTFNQLKNEHPDYDTKANGTDTYMGFGGAAFPYLGAPGAMYNYVFFGTQWGPSLGDVAGYFGDEMECIGVIAKLGVFFPFLDWDLTFSEFFDDYVVVEDYYVYDWDNTDGPVVGQIYFRYLDFDVTIRATESHTSETLKEDFYTLMTEGDITRNEEYLIKTQEKLNAG